jgi:hypothetical protein
LGFDVLAVILEVACSDCEPDGKSFPRIFFLFPLLVKFGVLLVLRQPGMRKCWMIYCLSSLIALEGQRFAADIMAAVFVIMMVTGEVYFR